MMKTPGPGEALRARLGAERPATLAVWLGLAVGICVPYFALQQLHPAPETVAPEWALDRAVPFQPGWIWPYLSLALLVPLAPALAERHADLERYARGLALLCASCFLLFWWLPVAGPRPEAPPDHGLYRWLVSVDRPSNSFPSLHAGLALYSLCFGLRVLRDEPSRALRRAAWWVGPPWLAAILYSTLATKQHWAVDLPAGLALAALAHVLAWRSAEPGLKPAARTPTPGSPAPAPSPRALDTDREPSRGNAPR